MKWLVVLSSLFVHGQVSALGLCKPAADGEGLSNSCIAGWDGASNAVAYSSSLSAMIEKLVVVIVYDSYANARYNYGHQCIIEPGDPEADPPRASRGCSKQMPLTADINNSLALAFIRTTISSAPLRSKLDAIAHLQVSYYYKRTINGNVPEMRDKVAACNTVNTHKRIAPLWNNFADNFQRDYDAYQDKYRKKIFKHYFQATKRLYGIYAKRMKKLMKKVNRDYACDSA